MCAMAGPNVKTETVLLDEPSMGLAPQLVEEIFMLKPLTKKKVSVPAG